MVSKVQVVLMVLGGVVVAFGALGTASASAGWLVNGSPLSAFGGSAALSPQALADAVLTLLFPVVDLVIQCDGHFLDGVSPQIFGSDKESASSLAFLECKTVTPENCQLAGGTTPIKTVAILALATKGKAESVNLTFKPETKTTFTNIAFSEGGSCPFDGVSPVTGSFVLNASTGQLSLLAQTLTGLGSTEGNNSLIMDGDRVFIDGGGYLLTLASNSKWSFD
jgi:hypothetical protein